MKLGLEVCNLCYKSIPFISEDYNTQRIMPYTKGSIDQIICLCEYSGIIKSTLIKFKFFDKPGYYRVFSQLLLEKIQNMTSLRDVDIIMSVPLYRGKKRERGYNQSYLISNYLAKELKIKEGSRLLVRKKDTQSQSLLKKRNERYLNMKDAFEVSNASYLANKKVLLIDDIITTGFTLEECSKVLKKAGASMVIGAVIASSSDSFKKREVF
jgi:competence protein ComFC